MMNLLQLKYILEVEKTRSITKAAENLYMGQPNLSRSIKELEDSLGFDVFSRTSRGMVPTKEGEEVLIHARKAIDQIEAIDQIGKRDLKNKQCFSISVPRVSYIAQAFTSFTATLDRTKAIELDYTETNSMQAIDNVLTQNHNMAIIRFRAPNESAFTALFEENDLEYEVITEFTYQVLFSKDHPLADREYLEVVDLVDQIELVHGDPFIPTLSRSKAMKMEIPNTGNKKIYLYERGGQYDLLSGVPGTYMWVSPVPDDFLARHGLVLKSCGPVDSSWVHKDVLIYKKNRKLSELDTRFINELYANKRLVFDADDDK